MSATQPNSIEDRIYVLRTRWDLYMVEGRFEQFIEFAVAVNSLVEHFNRMRLPGLMRICEGLENAVLALLGKEASHPLEDRDMLALRRQMDTLLGAVASARPAARCRARARRSRCCALALDRLASPAPQHCGSPRLRCTHVRPPVLSPPGSIACKDTGFRDRRVGRHS